MALLWTYVQLTLSPAVYLAGRGSRIAGEDRRNVSQFRHLRPWHLSFPMS